MGRTLRRAALQRLHELRLYERYAGHEPELLHGRRAIDGYRGRDGLDWSCKRVRLPGAGNGSERHQLYVCATVADIRGAPGPVFLRCGQQLDGDQLFDGCAIVWYGDRYGVVRAGHWLCLLRHCQCHEPQCHDLYSQSSDGIALYGTGG